MTTSTHVGGSCAAPDCEKLVFFSSSPYCHLHQHRATQVPVVSNGPSATSPTGTSRILGRGFTAKRGRRRFFPTSSHPVPGQDPRSRETSSTGPSPRTTQSPTTKASDLGPAPKSNENATSSQVKPLTIASIQKQLRVNLQVESVGDINQPSNQAPVANMGPESRDLETYAETNGQNVHSTAAKGLDLTTRKTLGDVPAPRGFKKAEPFPEPTSQPKLSPTTLVKFTQSNSENSADLKPRLLASPKPSDSPKRSEHHSQKLKNPTNRPLTPAKRPAHQASKTLPVRTHPSQVLPPEVSTEVDDEVNMADVSDIDDEVPKPAKAVLPFRTKVESRRKRLLAEFDSEAFDSLIYRQSSMRPPAKVIISSRTVRYESVLPEREPLYLPVNPAIHQMHKRSSTWRKNKTNEISQRPRKKALFGKAVERARRERDTKMKHEQKRRQAERNGTIPPYKPPEPRSVRRLLDFGDVAEEDLPDYVRSNPAWLKACAWHRDCERKAALHQQRVDKSTQEAERFYNETFGGDG
ncbi:hypothetical protein F53441_7417 [Fusarium austroafricanum]|uniref:Uncharacterized protein n=1 Tax=Fusarium austroafricanum TaxID=2364996 RepID=A0A8H4KFL4_9HYPO|nr:hypothetical protein F53441_7417 [Fusarium austroafricanum]